MHVNFIHKAVNMLPDSSSTSQFLSGVERALDNARLFYRNEKGPWAVYTLCSGIRPVILPDPVARVRFTEDQLNQRDMPGWDANFTGKLLLPKLPLPRKQRFFLMKIRSSSATSPVDKSNGLELGLWKHFSKTYNYLASSNIHRVDHFDARDPVELANLL
jgi:hypothetical protein